MCELRVSASLRRQVSRKTFFALTARGKMEADRSQDGDIGASVFADGFGQETSEFNQTSLKPLLAIETTDQTSVTDFFLAFIQFLTGHRLMNQDWQVEMEINSKQLRQKRQEISSHHWAIWVQTGLWNWVQVLGDIRTLFFHFTSWSGCELALFSPTAKKIFLYMSPKIALG